MEDLETIDRIENRDDYISRLQQAAGHAGTYAEFLDTSNSTSERLHAITTAHGLPTSDQVDGIAAVILDRGEDPDLRAAALNRASNYVGDKQEWIDDTLAILKDPTEPVELRRETLSVLQQLKFQSLLFNANRSGYLDTLRSLVDDPDETLRAQVLEILSLEKDEYAQRRLLESLSSPDKALLPEVKTLQLLGNDIHSDYFPICRQIAQTSTNVQARKQAVKLLGSDPESSELLTAILRNKSEDEDVRKASAVALHSLNPADFHLQARQVIMDDTENDGLRAVSITALSHFAEPDALKSDSELRDHIKGMTGTPMSESLGAAVSQFDAKRYD